MDAETPQILKKNHEYRELRNQLTNIIDSMPSLLIVVDENQRVVQWNRWAVYATRVSARKAIGRELMEVFPELARQQIDLTAALKSGQVQTWQNISWTLPTRKIYVDLTVYPLRKRKGQGAVLRADETTNRVRMEELMVLSEKMLSIGSLAAGMAHEINNPLAIILQHTQILQNRLSPQLNKNLDIAAQCHLDLNSLACYLEQRGINDMLNAIRSAGDRAKKIVDEMVNFAQRRTVEYAPCDIAALIDETLHLAETDYELKKKYHFRDIEIIKEVQPALPPLVCDRHEIQQALLNLLRNSAKALDQATTTKPQVRITLGRHAANLRLCVEDNGTGIKPEIIKRIFDPFFTTAQEGEGTGLGLSAAYFIVCEKHRGQIHAENLPQGGCRFSIELPYDAHLPAGETAS
jgi:PAS domain S-box-containing protein